jgi:hypothetical protein
LYEEIGTSITNKDGAMYMEQFEDKVTPMQLTTEYREAVDIFPALHKYKIEHTTDNLKKLCVEVASFCNAIYASTQNEEERNIYFEMLDKLHKR